MKTAIRESHLSLRGITVTYADGHTALAPTSLEVQHGAFLVLLGASGAGKSTLLRSINGLVSPTDGEVSVADLPGGTVSKRNLLEHRRHCGMVFQQHHLIGRQSVLANVLMGKLATRGSLASLWPWSKADKLEALAAIDRVGLLEKAQHGQTPCLVGNNNALALRVPWCKSPACCWPMSRWPASTRRPRRVC